MLKMAQNDRSWHEKQPLDLEKSKEAPRKSSYPYLASCQ